MHALKRFGTAFGGYKMMENYIVLCAISTYTYFYFTYLLFLSRLNSQAAIISPYSDL